MFVSGHDIGFIKRFARALTALAFLIANIAPSYAQNFAYQQRGATSFAGMQQCSAFEFPSAENEQFHRGRLLG